MSKRFGRNQKRALQIKLDAAERMATEALAKEKAIGDAMGRLTLTLGETQAALAAELGSVFRPMTGEELWVIPEANVRRYRDTTDYRRADQMHEVERTAEVDLIQFTKTEQLMDALGDRFMRSRELVAFRGVRWMIVELEANRSESEGLNAINGPGGYFQFTAHLRAVARRPA